MHCGLFFLLKQKRNNFFGNFFIILASTTNFVQNLNSSTENYYIDAEMSNQSTYYCNAHCCYLGSGNNQANNLSSFQNFGLPLNINLRVRDRGCGNYITDFSSGQNTTDSITVNSNNTFNYTQNYFGSSDLASPSPSSFSELGVIVCQEP